MQKSVVFMVCLVLMLLAAPIGTVIAHENDANKEVKVGSLFDVIFPSFDQKSADCKYTWECTYDHDHLHQYVDTDGNVVFKALQKGKTVMLAQLNEHNYKTGHDRIVKSVAYTIKIK